MSATVTTERTYVNIRKIDMSENGLVDTIRILNNKKTHDRIAVINNTYDVENMSVDIEKCEYYDVYARPVNGSRIYSFSYTVLHERQSHGSVNGGQNPWSDSTQDPQPGEEWSWEDIYLLPSNFNYYTEQIDYDFEGAGCIYLGEEFEEKYTSTEIEHSEVFDYDRTYMEYCEDVVTDMWMVEGETNYIDVEVIGNQSSDKFIYYTLDRSNGDQQTYILRKTPSPQTYTNVIVFNEKYNMYGSRLPTYFQVCDTGSVSDNFLTMNNTFDELNHKSSRFIQFLQKSSKLDIFEQSYVVQNSNENKIKSMLIYVDCAFAAFTPSPYYDSSTKKHYFYSTVKEEETYSESYIKQHGIRLQQIPCYDLLMRNCKSGQYLYLSHQDYNNKLSIDDQSQLETRVYNPLVNIPKEHRWVQLLGLSQYNKLTGYNAIVHLINEDSVLEPSHISIVEDGYVRYTKYWFVETWYNYDEMVMKDDWIVSDTRNGTIENRIFYPIVKPWAAVHMNVFPEQEGNVAFGCARTNNWTYKTVKSKLNEEFKDNGTQFYREIKVDANSYFPTVFEKVKKYGRMVSPFRVETYTCHGARKEYDNDSPSLNGRDVIVMSKNVSFKTTGWNTIHEIVDQYNESIFSRGYMYWNVLVESCFGQGIKTEQSRRDNINSKFISSTLDLLPNSSNAFVTVGAVGTHTDYGSSTGWGVGSSIMCKLMSDTITYQKLTDNFNNLVKKCKEQTFKIIKNFYTNNFSEMLFCLKDETTKLEWVETQDLINQDLTNYNQGRKYFTQFDWEKFTANGYIDPCYKASDNYFDIPKREYRINDGFIGVIKNAMCAHLTENDPWKCFKKFNNPQGMELLYADMVNRCKNNIRQCAKKIETLYRNALSTKYYNKLALTSSIIEPRMFVSGKLKNAKFLDYPKEDANMKKWLTSDVELSHLFKYSSNCGINDL